MSQPNTEIGLEKVFLGGTVGNSKWRERFLSSMNKAGLPTTLFFNPVVPNWNSEAQVIEDRKKATTQKILFYITDPELPIEYNIDPLEINSVLEALYNNPAASVCLELNLAGGHILKVLRKIAQDIDMRFPQAKVYLESSVETNLLPTIHVSPPDNTSISFSAYSIAETIMALHDNLSRVVVGFDPTFSLHTSEIYAKLAEDLKERFPTANILLGEQEIMTFFIKELS